MNPVELLPRRGNWLTKWIGRSVLAALRWHIDGPLPAQKKIVAIAAPHTSNWDFIIGIAVVAALQLDVLWLGKHSIFKPPFGWFFRWLGGIPVDRSSSSGVVGQIAALFAEREKMILGLSPEGTRKKVERWKTGFYHIAMTARVPILLVAFDYATKRLRIGPTVFPTGDLESDLLEIRKFYSTAKGKHPQLAQI